VYLQAENVSFKLSVVGYQFPNDATSEYDSNWLNVKIEATHPKGNWARVDPALLTYEVEGLAKWLEGIASVNPPSHSASFVEPNLEFEVRPESQSLRVMFRLEFTPPWASRVDVDDREYPFIEFPLAALDLNAAARSLREQLERCPQRAGC
jgi:hypothetical protein